jgi:4a-hydroxytetrahydrobiopterin dehydratase
MALELIHYIDMWQEIDNALYRKFSFRDFDEAFAFMEKVAVVARQQDHHPRWQNSWNTVEIWLSTHSAGDMVTDKDRQLAAAIDQLLPEAEAGGTV